MDLAHTLLFVMAMVGALLITAPFFMLPVLYTVLPAIGAFSTIWRKTHPGGSAWRHRRHLPS